MKTTVKTADLKRVFKFLTEYGFMTLIKDKKSLQSIRLGPHGGLLYHNLFSEW